LKKAFSKKNLWDKSPDAVKRAVGVAVGMVPLPWLLGNKFRQWYRFAVAADQWDSERIRSWQLQQIQRITALAYERSDYYRDSFKNAGFEPGDLKSLDDVCRLPTIDKNTIREQGARMLTCPADRTDIDMVTTGGTSGEPLRFHLSSSRHAWEFAHLTAAWRRIGYRPGDRMAVLRGKVIKHPRHGIYYSHDPLLRHHYYSTFHMTPAAMTAYVQHMHAVRPSYLHAYPSAFYALAQHVCAAGLRFPSSIKAVLLESEAVLPHQRKLGEEKLGLRVFSSYGMSEKVILAAGCEHSATYHVLPTYGYCEVLTEDGRRAHAGQSGEITGTSLLNEAMPLIRYRTGDHALLAGQNCSGCGREQMLLETINGRREQEFLICRDGKTTISMTALNLHDDTFAGVLRFQFEQKKPGEALLKLLPASASAFVNIALIKQHFQPKLGHSIDLEPVIVDQIPLTPLGKQPLIL